MRQASPADEGPLRHLLADAQRVVLQFSESSLGNYLSQEPFLLAEEAGQIKGFLAWAVRLPQQGSLAAAGLTDGVDVAFWLDLLLPPCVTHLRQGGITALSYTGSAAWLLDPLQERGFCLISHIVTFEKSGWSIPVAGNQDVIVRPVQPADYGALVALDSPSFHPRWRNSLESLRRWRESLPYFVVATATDAVVGYCYCSIEDQSHGHLIRVAVHPDWWGRGIGSRLMAEAMRYFQQAGVRYIALNTQEENKQAQRLYQRFGFQKAGSEATALWRKL